jgi:hypothetical protein
VSAMRPLPRHAAHVSPEFGALMDRSSLVTHRLPIKHRMVYRHGLLGDSEPRRDRHPSFRVADDCPDEFLRTTCRE